MSLLGLFPTIIYETILKPPKHIQQKMVEYVRMFHEKRKCENQYPNVLGDYLGDSNISNEKEFFWLNDQISLHTIEYLKGINADSSCVSLFAQKSWPVVCPKEGGAVYKHKHKNSCLSAVFYIQVEESNDTGNLIFYPPSDYHHLSIPIRYNLEDFYLSKHKVITNKLIIFPSSLEHEVSHYSGNSDRYSVSYDITIISNDLNHNENYIANPNLWTKL